MRSKFHVFDRDIWKYSENGKINFFGVFGINESRELNMELFYCNEDGDE